MSDFVRNFFKMFLVVELTKLGRHYLYLGLHWIYFCHQRSNLTFLREKNQKTMLEKSNSIFAIKNISNGGLEKHLFPPKTHSFISHLT